MHYKDPFVLILNITVIVILCLLILPTLLNRREKLGVRISYSMIFLVVVVNCISNLIIFYFENFQFLSLHFSFMFFPFLFGPCIYFYVILSNGEKVKNILVHFIFPTIIFLFGFSFLSLSHEDEKKIIQQMIAGEYMVYNVINTLVMAVPMYYFVTTRLFLRRLKLDEGDPLYAQKVIKKNWSKEFVNYIMFSVFSYLIITVIATYFLKVPQPYLDLIGMPIYFPFIYAIVAVRSNMISKELEVQYVLSKSENENKLHEQRLNISRDLHDNIGAYANSLLLKIDNLSKMEEPKNPEQIKDLKENAESILSLLRQTIWVLNNDEVSIEAFMDYLKQYTLKSFYNTHIKVIFNEDIQNNRILSSKEASHIFRILQEAIQNIMKHSQANLVKISIKSNPIFEIAIEDDGIGFEERKISDGYGLQNMNQRAKQINMMVKLQTVPSMGTKITISDNYV